MRPTTVALALAFWFLNLALLVDAGIFVLKPSQGSLCHGGQKCTIEWIDDGSSPLLPAIGVCNVGLYTGKQKLVQTIQPVDVSKTHSVTFTPILGAGPNSDTYYISILSTSVERNGSIPYAAFSPPFRIDQMTGSFDTPLPSAIAPIPIPSSLSSSKASGTNTVVPTITVGTLSTSLPPLSTLSRVEPTSTTQPSLTRLSTSIRPSTSVSSSSGTGTPAPTTTSSNGALSHTASLGTQVPGFICLTLLALCSFL